jgi:hypothetical protein
MSEIINILKEELKYDSAIKREWISNSACEGKPQVDLHQCSNYSLLETHVTPVTTRYAVPVTNRYAVLSRHHEQQVSNDRIYFSKIEQPPRFRATNNYKNVKELQRNKTVPVNQP